MDVRRPVALLAAALGSAAMAACGGDERSGSDRGALVSGSFVGKVSGTDAYVAVVAAEPTGGASQRAVRVYVCDGKDLVKWFPGRGGNAFAADSDDGDAHVEATVTRKAASGIVRLAGGRLLEFSARPATGIAGLYDSRLFPDGRVRGASETGVRIVGRRVSPRPVAGKGFRATGRYVEPDGDATPWTTYSRVRAPRARAVESRIIVLVDGSRRGSFKSSRVTFAGGSHQPQ